MKNALRFKALVYLFGLLALWPLAGSPPAWSHPVSYKGAWLLETHNSPSHSRYYLNYSITSRISFGGSYERTFYKLSDAELVYPQVNFLVHRWNLSNAQANVYAMFKVGQRFWESTSRPFFGGALQLDYETRKVFVAAISDIKRSSLDFRLDTYKFKAGFAPYVADFDELNTWMLGYAAYHAYGTERWEGGPVLRFFYHNVFWEIGATNRGQIFLMTMLHF